LVCDSHLRGVPGYALFIRDNKGNRIPDLNYPIIQPIDGNDITTTINVVYQNILEDELKKTVLQHQAVNGTAILLNVGSGEILALANYPGFDPNTYNEFPIKNYRNIAISDQFEPGSTFKIVALSLMLEQLKLDLKNETIFCENGKYKIYGRNLKDHKKFGNLSLQEVIENSSNIGMAKLARKFQAPLFYRYARDFGFGTITGIGLPAEIPGILHKPSEFQKTSLPYMSIGYEVAVTPLQIACAYAAVANGGKLLKPYLVKKVVNKDGNVLLKNKARVIRQVINPVTARKMGLTLEGVVEHGTGQSAGVKGLAIAGKTGTARKIETDKNGKNRYVSKYISSFAGFFPVDSPQYALVILINEPQNDYYGSQVAAPAFSNIAKRIIGIPVENEIHLTEKAGLIDKITSLW
jgi:cell division protein FtsI (penicillin-binding protein 3)